MAKFAALVLFSLVASAVAYDPRIVGGVAAAPGEFPHQVALKRSGSFICGGSIIRLKWILTAAHCVADNNNNIYPATSYRIVAGTNNYNNLGNTGVEKTVKRIISHPNYGNFRYDIALMELEIPFVETNYIKPAALETGKIPENAQVVISGWGRLTTNGQLPASLQKNTLTKGDVSACSMSGVVYDGLLCLKHASGHGACNGDSGGPAAFNGKIVGVANFVVGGCGSAYPDGYAKVAFFVPWINTVIGTQ